MKNLLLFLFLCFAGYLAAQSDGESPYFVVEGTGEFPLTATDVDVNIAGVIAAVTVTQTYVNAGDGRLEATYVFPASTNAAVHGLTMVVGRRRIEGIVQRRAEARATYEAAKAEGKRASLLEQERANVFQMNVANILPGDTVRVELRYTELLVPEDGVYSFVFPTVVGPRYTGESSGGGAYAHQGYDRRGKSTDFDLDLRMDAGMPVVNIGSPTHKVSIRKEAGEAMLVDLDGSERRAANRDFILHYGLRGDRIQTGLLLFEGADENYFLYTAQPPAKPGNNDFPPREFVFILDVSGSMTGFPLDVAKEMLTKLVGQLRPVDRFNIQFFAGGNQLWQPASVAATAGNLRTAIDYLGNVNGGGGTQLLAALETAYALPRNTSGLSRNFVVLTDGYVNVEPEVFDLIDSKLDEANVYTFGIGSSVNRLLIEGMARIGRGRPAVVLDRSKAREEADRFRRYISEPVLTGMQLDFNGFAAYDVEPTRLPDVSTQRPLVVFGKYRGKAKGKLVLTGFGGEGEQTFTTKVSAYRANEGNAALSYLWARERIRRLDDYNNLSGDDDRVEEVTQLGLAHNLLTRYTSFVAVEREPAANLNDPLRTVKQPLPLPDNVSATAVGFDLGLVGISGLPLATVTVPWFAYALLFVLAGILLYLLLGRRAAFFLVLAVGVFGCETTETITVMEASLARIDTSAATVTFVLGEDAGSNVYYDRAASYFSSRSEYLIHDVRSIAGVRDFLLSHEPVGGQWQRVHLVVHGNQWTGLSTALEPGAGERVTAAQLANWEPRGRLETVGAATEVIVHGCSVGKDSALLLHLSRVLGGADGSFPRVSASPYFTLFREGTAGPERHYADYVFRAHPLGRYPTAEVMANRFARDYPEKQVDWDEALAANRFDAELAPHLYQFNVPVDWLHVYPNPEERVLPADRSAERQWLAGEPRLNRQLDRMGLQDRDFNWTFVADTYTLADGSTLPAVRARGVARLFCVLLPTEDQRLVTLRWS